jgi:hypothetical protein
VIQGNVNNLGSLVSTYGQPQAAATIALQGGAAVKSLGAGGQIQIINALANRFTNIGGRPCLTILPTESIFLLFDTNAAPVVAIIGPTATTVPAYMGTSYQQPLLPLPAITTGSLGAGGLSWTIGPDEWLVVQFSQPSAPVRVCKLTELSVVC